MSRQPGRRYFPVGPTRRRHNFWMWGELPDGYDVWIEIRDLHSERDAYDWPDGYQKVVVTGPQPRPRSKAFTGELAWSDAGRYASDVVAELQRNTR